MPTPSLILVPARFKTGKLYTPVATTSGGTVLGASGDFNVTRATTATRVNASGLIEVVASGIPRLDYPLGGGCPALLVEPSGTNLVLQSENFTTTWLTLSATVSGNVAVAPDGALTADLITTSATGNNIRQSPTVVSGTTYTFSCYIKNGDANNVSLVMTSAAFPASVVNFNLVSGTASSTTGAPTFRIDNVGSDWYRCSMSVTATSSAAGACRIQSASANAVSTFYVWGAQVETGSVATSYIPTTTAAVTRNADVILVSGAVSGSIGQTEGAFYAEVDLRLLGTNRSLFSLTLNSTTTDFINFQINTSNRFFARIRNKSGSLADVVASGVTTTAGMHKLACSYSSGDITFALDGVIIGTNTNANADFTAPLNCVLLGCGPTATGNSQSSFSNDRIRAAALYTTRLTNDQLAALTTP
jgi:hypothetical protein